MRTASLENGLVLLDINGAGQNITFVVTNNDPSRGALFNVFNMVAQDDGTGTIWQPGTLIVWSLVQPPNSTSVSTPVPTVDKFGQPINWTIGQVTAKSGAKVTTVVAPDWQLTMQ